MHPEIHALLVEPDDDHASLIRRVAHRAGMQVHTRTSTLASTCQALRATGFDLVLLDLTLPDSQDLHTLEAVMEADPDVPVVVLGTAEDDPRSMEVLSRGAEDYLGPAELSPTRLARASRFAIERHRMRLQRQRDAEALDRFTASIARDLRQPADTMSMIASWMRDDCGPRGGAYQEYVRMLEETSKEVRTLLEDLVVYAEAAGGTSRPMPTELGEVVSAAITQLEPHRRVTGTQIAVECLPVAMVDAKHMEAAIRHLLLIPLTRPSLVDGRLRIRGRVASALFVEMVIEHDGYGFAHLDSEDGAHDAALGLALARRIIESHGGTLATRSDAGGSLAWLTLSRVPREVVRAVGAVHAHRD